MIFWDPNNAIDIWGVVDLWMWSVREVVLCVYIYISRSIEREINRDVYMCYVVYMYAHMCTVCVILG